MAAPTLFAEGASTANTSGNLTPTMPSHQADDILILCVTFWGPNTAGDAAVVPTPSGWTEIANVATPASPIDGRIAYFWKRAASGSETVTVTRGASWDTGTDTNFSCRVYCIRGCITIGDPWDEADITVIYNTANQAFDAVTVSGSERMVVQFCNAQDDWATNPTTPAGWTQGAVQENTSGTDNGYVTWRKDNVSADTGTDAPTIPATTQGYYTYLGISFKPPSVSDLFETGTTTMTGSQSGAEAPAEAGVSTIIALHSGPEAYGDAPGPTTIVAVHSGQDALGEAPGLTTLVSSQPGSEALGEAIATVLAAIEAGGEALAEPGLSMLAVIGSALEALGDSGRSTFVVVHSGVEETGLFESGVSTLVALGSGLEIVAEPGSTLAVLSQSSSEALADSGGSILVVFSSGLEESAIFAAGVTVATVVQAVVLEALIESGTTTAGAFQSALEALVDSGASSFIVVHSGVELLVDVSYVSPPGIFVLQVHAKRPAASVRRVAPDAEARIVRPLAEATRS
jgi:hypothetical protein